MKGPRPASNRPPQLEGRHWQDSNGIAAYHELGHAKEEKAEEFEELEDEADRYQKQDR